MTSYTNRLWRTKALMVLSKAAGLARQTGLQRVQFARSAKRWMERSLVGRNETLCAEVEGQKMQLWADEKWRMYALLRGKFDPFMTQCFRDAIRSGDVVLDIGAHIGFYTLIAAAKAGEAGKVYAFEPEPNNFALLARNVDSNNYDNVIEVPTAVAGTRGRAVLFRHRSHTGIHSFYVTDNERFAREEVIVDQITIDDFLPGDVQVNVIKLDIEGGEPWACRGMCQTLARSKAVKLFVELNPQRLRVAGVSPQEFLSELKDLGFDRIFLIDEKRHSLISFGTYRDELVDSDGGENLLCMKGL